MTKIGVLGLGLIGGSDLSAAQFLKNYANSTMT